MDELHHAFGTIVRFTWKCLSSSRPLDRLRIDLPAPSYSANTCEDCFKECEGSASGYSTQCNCLHPRGSSEKSTHCNMANASFRSLPVSVRRFCANSSSSCAGTEVKISCICSFDTPSPLALSNFQTTSTTHRKLPDALRIIWVSNSRLCSSPVLDSNFAWTQALMS